MVELMRGAVRQVVPRSTTLWLALVGLACGLCLPSAEGLFAQSIPPTAERLAVGDSETATFYRDGRCIYVELANPALKQVAIPRWASSLRSWNWMDESDDGVIRLQPEQDHWLLSWSQPPAAKQPLVLEFDSPPLIPAESDAIQPAGDGSLYLPAHLATTRGEKVRYEPQPYKNTLGFWTGKQDEVEWEFRIDRPGSFNIALLQGCGSGQGGSQGVLEIIPTSVDETVAANALEFEVLETGHFQDFRWRDVGSLSLDAAGKYLLRVRPVAIRKAALMDLRAIHLIRKPDASP